MDQPVQDTDFLLQNLMENMVDKAFCEWTGVDREQVIGKTDFDLFAEVHARLAYEGEQRIIHAGEPLVDIEEETWSDGRITWVSTTKMPLKNRDGETIGIFGISRDITDHKEAEFRAADYDEQIRAATNRMEEDVRAGDLQRTFFPQTYPEFPVGAAPEECCVEFLHRFTDDICLVGFQLRPA